MKNVYKSRYKQLLLVASLLLICAIAQGVGVIDGMLSLKQMYKGEEDFIHHVMNTGDLWHMKYVMNTQVLNPQTKKLETVVSKGEVVAGKHIRYIKTDEVELIVDNKDKFTIVASDRSIMRTPATARDIAADDDVYRSIIQDSTLKYYQLSSCKNVIDNNQVLICYELSAKDARRCPYTTLSMYEDAQTHVFKKLTAVLNPAISKKISAYTFTVLERDEWHTSKEWEKARNRVFNAAGQLNAAYKGYHYTEYKN